MLKLYKKIKFLKYSVFNLFIFIKFTKHYKKVGSFRFFILIYKLILT